MPSRKPFSLFSAGEPLRCPAAPRGLTAFSPLASGVAGRYLARDAQSLPSAVPHRALRAPRYCLVACEDGARTIAPRRSVQECPCRLPKFANRCLDSAGETPRCPAARRGPRSYPLVANAVAARCLARSALSLPRSVPQRALRAPRSGLVDCDDAARTLAPRCDVQGCPFLLPNSQTVLPILCRRTASLPRRPPWPHVFLPRRQWRRGALPRARSSKPAARRATPHVSRASLRLCGLRRCGPHSWAAPRRPRMPVPRSPFANRF